MSNANGIYPMAMANIISLILIVFAYFAYSKFLSIDEFAVYSVSLVIAKFGILVLDGGLKSVFLRRGSSLDEKGLHITYIFSQIFAGVVCVLGVGISYAMIEKYNDVWFYFFYFSAYVLSYPYVFFASVKFEKSLNFRPVALSESLGLAIEYAGPALMIFLTETGMQSFLVCVWAGRGARILIFNFYSNGIFNFAEPRASIEVLWSYLKEGFYVQMATLASLIRDNLHVLLIGPLFGKEALGNYAWAMQLCGVTSQVFVQTASRIVLPRLGNLEKKSDRLELVWINLKWLCVLTVPAIVLVVPAADFVNRTLFEFKWFNAIGIVPFIAIRMFAGIATTPFGALYIVSFKGKGYFKANALWTGIELLGAFVLTAFYGEFGLAYSYALCGYAGCYIFCKQFGAVGCLSKLVRTLFYCAPLWIALSSLFFLDIYVINEPNFFFGFLVFLVVYIISVLSSKEMRCFLIRRGG